jgi:hypothetical protein
MQRSKMKPSTFAVPSRKAYPLPDIGHARNAIARVQQHGSPVEKAAVFSKVRTRYPALAKRSSVVPTRTGTGRHYGQPPGTTNRTGVTRARSTRARSTRGRRR